MCVTAYTFRPAVHVILANTILPSNFFTMGGVFTNGANE